MIYQKLQNIYERLDKEFYDDLTDYEKGLKDILNFIDTSRSGNNQNEMYDGIVSAIEENHKKNKNIITDEELETLNKKCTGGELPVCEAIAELIEKHINEIELKNCCCVIEDEERSKIYIDTLFNLMFIAQQDEWGCHRTSMDIYVKYVDYCLGLLGLKLITGNTLDGAERI